MIQKLRQTLESAAVFLFCQGTQYEQVLFLRKLQTASLTLRITTLHGESGLVLQDLQSHKHVNARDEDFYRCSFLALHALDREA